MTADVRPAPARRRPVAGDAASSPPTRYRVRRLQAPAWVDGPMTSCHLVLGAAGLLLAIGLVMVFSASSIEAALADEPAWAPGVQQLAWACFGLVAMWVALRLPTGALRRWSPVALIVVAFMLLIVLVPGIGLKVNGARQWFNFGFAHLQPSEVAKLVFALWGAHVLALRDRYLSTRTLLVPVVPVYLVLCGLLILEPDFGSVVTLFLVLVGLLWAGGAPWKVWAWLVGAGGVAGTVLIAFFPYRAARITEFLHPFADPTDGGFQAIHGFYALAAGGFWGVGLGNSRMKWDLLPHAESDYIFAIIGEELGFLGCLVVVALYGVLAWAGFRIARRAADRFIQLATVAITVWLIGQATMNMGYVVGLLPVTGVTLPLISAGGTSLVLTLFIVGLLARFARSEPAAIEFARAQERGRLARFLLPVPERAVDPVRLHRRPAPEPTRRPPRPERRPAAAARTVPDRQPPVTAARRGPEREGDASAPRRPRPSERSATGAPRRQTGAAPRAVRGPGQSGRPR
jgi:cell division protein FtsW